MAGIAPKAGASASATRPLQILPAKREGAWTGASGTERFKQPNPLAKLLALALAVNRIGLALLLAATEGREERDVAPRRRHSREWLEVAVVECARSAGSALESADKRAMRHALDRLSVSGRLRP